MTNTIDPDSDDRWLYQAGGISALALGIGYIAIIALYIPIGAPPSGVEPWLIYVAKNTKVWWAILDVSVLTDFLFVPVALSLYVALKGFRNAMLLATAFVMLFVVLDLAVTWTNYAALIALSGHYATAVNDAQRAAVISAASYPCAVLESKLLFVYNSLTLAVGILLTGLVMLKGIFSKTTAYLGVATGILGIVSVAGAFFISSSAPIILTSILITIWVFFVGYRLCRLQPARPFSISINSSGPGI